MNMYKYRRWTWFGILESNKPQKWQLIKYGLVTDIYLLYKLSCLDINTKLKINKLQTRIKDLFIFKQE